MTAVEVKDVDNSIVIAGGVIAANFPQVARNLRRSAAAASFSGAAIGFSFGLTARPNKPPVPNSYNKPKLNEVNNIQIFNLNWVFN
jgi:hypothetical protein